MRRRWTTLLLVVFPLLASGADRPSAPDLPDDRIERILLEGSVTDMREIGSGVTRPMKVTLQFEGQTRNAAFKSVDVFKRGVTQFGSGTEINFKDSYRFERAAYLIDRKLGLHMVPVTVIRAVRSETGALIDWVDEATSEGDRIERNLVPANRTRMTYQRSVMDLFDALIGNVDRNLGNQLWTTADWNLHLIDHSRGFRTTKKLPERYAGTPSRLSRELLQALSALDADGLAAELDGLLDRVQIKALLTRRDRILAKIARDREEYDDDRVFPPEAERSSFTPDGE